MMNFIKFIFVTLSLFLSSCIAKDESSHLILASTEVDSNFNQNNQGLGRRRVGNQGSKCIDSDDCVDICEDIYSKRYYVNTNRSDGAVDACTDLRSRIVFEFQDIIDALNDPNQNNLKNIDTGIFKEFVTISLGPWQDKLKRISGRRGEIQQILIWLASSSEISKAIKLAYDNNLEGIAPYDGIISLLEELQIKGTKPTPKSPSAWIWNSGSGSSSSSCCNMIQALNEPLITKYRSSTGRAVTSKSIANLAYPKPSTSSSSPPAGSSLGFELFDDILKAEGCPSEGLLSTAFDDVLQAKDPTSSKIFDIVGGGVCITSR